MCWDLVKLRGEGREKLVLKLFGGFMSCRIMWESELRESLLECNKLACSGIGENRRGEKTFLRGIEVTNRNV